MRALVCSGLGWGAVGFMHMLRQWVIPEYVVTALLGPADPSQIQLVAS